MTTEQAKLLINLSVKQADLNVIQSITESYRLLPECIINWQEVARKFADMGENENAEKALMFLTESK